MIAEHDEATCKACGAAFQRVRKAGIPVVTCSGQCKEARRRLLNRRRIVRWRRKRGRA